LPRTPQFPASSIDVSIRARIDVLHLRRKRNRKVIPVEVHVAIKSYSAGLVSIAEEERISDDIFHQTMPSGIFAVGNIVPGDW
jgi:hypothetical protein